MERLTKLALTFWLGAAIALQIWILHFSWPALPVATLSAAAALAAAAWIDRRSVAIVLFLSYLFPALAFFFRGIHSYYYDALWMAALAGAMLPDLLRAPWRLPRPWRAALVYSALVVAAGAVVVVLREIDVQPLLLTDPEAIYWKGGLPPSFTIRWVLHVAITAVTGILWFDWLMAADPAEFDAVVIPALGLGAVATAIVSAYQLLVDDSFLNDTVFRNLGRTTGTFYDGNVAGMIAALWIAGAWVWAHDRPARRLPAIALTILFAVAVWGSGSRTALMVTAGVGAGIGISRMFRHGRLQVGRLVWVGVGGAIAVAAVVTYGATSARRTNPVGRLVTMLSTYPSIPALASELWNRNGYGTAAGYMIDESPLAGVGIGSFHGYVGDVAQKLQLPLTPDNAQNWLRHQVAELGVIGAIGWAAWTVLFAWTLCVPRRDEPASLWILRAALVAFGVASLLGMPGQDPAVMLTFWVFAAWYVKVRGWPAPEFRPLGVPTWAAIVAIWVAFVAASSVTAHGIYRLPERARAAGQPFSYGFGPIFGAGPDIDYRNVSRYAAALVEKTGPWLTVDTHLRSGGTPAEVRIRVNGQMMMKGRISDQTPFRGAMLVQGMPSPLLVELTAVPDAAGRDPFAAAASDVMMAWYFSDSVPASLRAERPGDRKD